MPELMENVKTINSAFRTLMMAGVLGGVGFGGWFGYENYVKPAQDAKQAIADLEVLQNEFEAQKQQLVKAQVENDRLATSMKLLKVDRRMANVEVLEKSTDEEGTPSLLVRFTEVDTDGNAVGASRDYTLSGEKLYIDCWIVSFDDKYVEDGDDLRSASLCVFKSIYGDNDGPNGAKSLDEKSPNNQAPGIYQDERKSEFEQQIWSDFWSVCNDPVKQAELGIRASYGQANYVLAEEGKTYQVHLRSSGGASLKPIEILD